MVVLIRTSSSQTQYRFSARGGGVAMHPRTGDTYVPHTGDYALRTGDYALRTGDYVRATRHVLPFREGWGVTTESSGGLRMPRIVIYVWSRECVLSQCR